MGWRRPIYRWNLRMFRREHRQWLLIGILLIATVAGGVVFVTAGFNLDTGSRSFMGDASYIVFQESGVEDLLADAQATFDAAALVQTQSMRPDGSASSVPVRSLEPDTALGDSLVDLVEGRYPSTGELAGTSALLDGLGATVGDLVFLDSRSFVAVGVVENPHALNEQFFLAAPGDLSPEQSWILVHGSADQADVFRGAHPGAALDDGGGQSQAVAFGLAALVGLVLVEVTLLAIAAMTVVAQRRVGQLGVLAALGAGRRQLRASVVASGVIIGVASAAIGLVTGVVLSMAIVPQLETFANSRIESVQFPWLVLGALAVVASLSTATAAWWPARRVARESVAGSLRASRPHEVRAVASTILAALLVVAGTAVLVLDSALEPPGGVPIVLYAAAVMIIPVGVVLATPGLVRLGGRWSPRRLDSRVAARDIGRYQARSAATMAALAVILAFPMAFAAGTRISEQSDGNLATLPPNVLLVSAEPERPGGLPGELTAFQAEVEALAASVNSEAVELVSPIRHTPEGQAWEIPAGVVDQGDVDSVEAGLTLENVPTYVATPQLMAALGLTPADLEGVDVVSWWPGTFVVIDVDDRGVQQPTTRSLERNRYSAAPGALLSPGYVEAMGWETAVSGWLVASDQSIDRATIAPLLSRAAASGLLLTTPEPAADSSMLRLWTLVIAVVLALGVVAVVAALHRSETAETDIAYEAIGAGNAFRRRVHAMTMTQLALPAVILAVVAGVLPQIGFAADLLGLSHTWEAVPYGFIVALVLIVPLATFTLTWLMGLSRSSNRPLTRAFR